MVDFNEFDDPRNNLPQLAFDPSVMPGFRQEAPPPPRNPFAAGFSSGVDDLQGTLGGFAAMGGALAGNDDLAQWGKAVKDRNEIESQQNGRADLDGNPFRGGVPLTSLPAWFAYQGSKQVPLVLGTMAAAAAAEALPVVGPAAAAISGALGLTRAGKYVGAALGMGEKAAAQLGTEGLLSGAVQYPVSAGSLYGAALDRQDAGGEKADRGDAAKAALMGIPYAAAEGAFPTLLHGMSKGLTAETFKGRLLKGLAVGAAEEIPTEAVQTAMEMSFRDDLSTQDKINQIVDSAVIGGAVGGMFGGAAGAISGKAKHAAPNEVTDEDLTNTVDQTVGTKQPPVGTQLSLFGDQPQQAEQLPLPLEMAGGKPLPETAVAPSSTLPEREAPAPREQQLSMFPEPAQAQQLDFNDTLNQERTPPSLSELFKGVPDDRLQNSLRIAEATAAKGDDNPTLARSLSLLRAEVSRRAEGRPDAFLEPTSLFKEADLAQPARSPYQAEQDDAAQRLALSRQRAEQLAGGKAPWISQLNVTDDVGLADAVLTRLEAGKTDKRTIQLGKSLGLVDENDKPISHDLAIAQVQQKQDAARVAALNENPLADPNQSDLVRPLSEQIGALTAAQKLVQSVQQRRAGGTAVEQQAQSEANVSTEPAPELQLNLRSPLPEGFVDTRNALRDIAARGGVNKDTAHSTARQMAPKTMGEAVQGTLAYLGSKPANRWAGPYKAWGVYFGLVKDGKLQSIPDAVQHTQEAIAAAQRAGDATSAGPLVQRLDALTMALNQKMEAPVTGPSAVTAPTTGGYTAEAKFRQSRAAEALHIIEGDNRVPHEMRARAKVVRAMVEQRAASAEERAQALMADYSALTGDRLASPMSSERDPEGLPGQTRESASVRNGSTFEEAANRKTGGEVVRDNGKTGLIRMVNAYGTAVYHPVKHTGTGVWVGPEPVSHEFYKGDTHPFTLPEVEKLRAQARVAHMEELDRLDNHPQGPFANMQPGMNAVGSESVSPQMTNLVSDWLQMLGLDHVRVFVVHPEDLRNTAEARAKYGLYGGFSPVFQMHDDPFGATSRIGARPGDHYILLRSDMTQPVAVEVMAHEMGHIIEQEIIDRLPAPVKAAIMADFKKWMADHKDMKPQDFVRAMRAAQTGSMVANETNPNEALNAEYWHSFSEWFADQVSKWATTSAKPVSAVEKFFAEIGRYLRKIVDLYQKHIKLSGDKVPVQGVKEFLDSMADTRDARAFLAQFGATIRTSNTEQVRGPSQMAGINAQTANRNVQETFDAADKAHERAKDMWSDLSLNAFQKTLGWFDVNHLSVQSAKNGFDHIKLYEAANEYRDALGIKFMNLLHGAIKSFETAAVEVRDMINDLMRATELQIDPRKPPRDHAHLKDRPNWPALSAEIERYNALWNKMGRIERGTYQGLYNALLAGNEAVNNARIAMLSHGIISVDPNAQAVLQWGDPTNDFLANQDLNGDPVATAAYWKKVVADRQAALSKYIDSLNDQLKDAPKEAKEDMGRLITVLEGIYSGNYSALKTMEVAPNFHMGRRGEFFVAFDLKTIGGEGKDKGEAHPAAVRLLQNEMKRAGFNDAQVSSLNGSKDVYVRLETASQAKRFEEMVRGPRMKSVISNVIQGMRSQAEVNDRVTPEALRKLEANVSAYFNGTIARLQKDDADGNKEKIAQLKQVADFVKGVMREQYLDSLPDSDIAKVLVHRERIPGYHPDMFRNNAFRMQLGIHSLASISAAPRISDAFQAMKDQIKADQSDTSLDAHERAKRQMVVEELQTREANKARDAGETWGDHLRAFTHNWYLAMNTAYAAINITQLGITTLPELAKNGGYIKAMQVMAKNSAAALRLVTETFKASYALGWRHMGDGTITNAVLDASKLSPQQKFILTQLANKGQLNLGGQSRQVGHVAQRPAPDSNSTFGDRFAHNWAGAMNVGASFGLYTEMYSRVLAGLSAAEMAPKGVDPVEHARQVIKDTLYDYTSGNAPRMMSKHSPLFGQATPAVLQFQNYSAFTIMKLTREFMDLFDGARRKEAATFLAGHTAGLVVLTGTMGVPLFNVFAKAAEMLKDAFGDDDKPWDAKASYRLWLKDMFGKDAGEMIAHGPLSRMLGQEVTARAGEADILPFSQLLTDKREMKDRLKDFESRGWGSIASMATNMAIGMEEIGKGNVMQGMQGLLPTFVKSAMKAYDLSEHGYVDKNGGKLPIAGEPTTGAIVNQLLGFMPSTKAEYNEEAFVNRQHKDILSKQSMNIRQNLAIAYERQNQDDVQKWVAEAQTFDRTNPAYAVLPKMASTLASREKARQTALALKQPLGVNTKDLSALAGLGFANY